MKKILIISDYFPPSKNGGGLLVGIPNILSFFRNDFDFTVLTNNHDVGDKKPFKSVPTNTLTYFGPDKVIYCNKDFLRARIFLHFLNSFDGIFITGLYSPMARKILLLNGRTPLPARIVISPMGCLDSGALAVKPVKKRLFLFACNSLGLFKRVSWAFSSPKDQEDSLKSIKSKPNRCFLATELPTIFRRFSEAKPSSSRLRLVYISRIVPKKNLLFALKILAQVRTREISFSVFGNDEDDDYLKQCLSTASTLPKNISFYYGGFLDSIVDCRKAFFDNDYLFFPTTSENYGYVILEALSAGTPAIISDQTFFTFISKQNAGIVLPLSSESEWVQAIEKAPNSSSQEYASMSNAAFDVYQNEISNAKEKSGYQALLRYLAGESD